jgi:sigma-B regulation protein RsbU (phosphoserine phosphatase)
VNLFKFLFLSCFVLKHVLPEPLKHQLDVVVNGHIMVAKKNPDVIKPSDLPTPPQAAIQILRACAKEDVSNAELAKLVSSDPMLTAELLRIVNSPFFGLSRNVKSIPNAVTILGQRALRNVVLCISVRDALQHQAIPGFNVTAYWEDSLRRAVSARLLGEAEKLNADECFTAGLLQDFGLLVMLVMHPDKGSLWGEMVVLDPESRYQLEQNEFATTHDQIALLLARAWSLPGTLEKALGHHHACDQIDKDSEDNRFCKILYAADWVAAAYSAANKGLVINRCRDVLERQFALKNQQIEEHLASIPKQVESAAQALGLHIHEQPDLEQILQQANVRLAEENLSYQELTWRLENTLKERDRLAAELDRELELAREIQQSLLPGNVEPDFPITGISVPARQLSGDFYDYFLLPDGRIYFNLADVSGKGITAALLMAKTSSLFHCLGKQLHNPGELLARLNEEINETATRGMFVTMIAGLYDPRNSQLTLVNAGHPPALLLTQDNKMRALDAQAPPLGIMPAVDFPAMDLAIPGGSLYLFSDGVTEGHIDHGKELGMNGLLQLIAGLRNLPGRERLAAIIARFEQSSLPLRDDVTILLLEDANGKN